MGDGESRHFILPYMQLHTGGEAKSSWIYFRNRENILVLLYKVICLKGENVLQINCCENAVILAKNMFIHKCSPAARGFDGWL